MGATSFEAAVPGITDPAEAFNAGRQDARAGVEQDRRDDWRKEASAAAGYDFNDEDFDSEDFDDDDEGYSGTLADKDDYAVIDDVVRPLDAALGLARQLVANRDMRIEDHHGPAAALAYGNNGVIEGWVFFGYAPW